MKRRRAIDANDHRWRVHAHRIDCGRRQAGTHTPLSPAPNSDGAGEPAQCELCLRGQLLVRGDGSLHAFSPMSASLFFAFDNVPYCTVHGTVRYSKSEKTQSKSFEG